MSPRTSNNAFVFPLYVLPEGNDEQGALFASKGMVPNLAAAFIVVLEQATGLALADKEGSSAFTPDDVLGYIYASLHSPAFKKRYAVFLKRDFPQIPLPTDAKQFSA